MSADSLTSDGASRLAKIVAEYWMKRGFHVVTRVEEAARANGKTMYGVRSDTINGMPQRKL